MLAAPRPRGDPRQARAVLGDEVDTLDSADALKHTRAVQLCLLIAGVAWARELQRQGVNPQMVSGLSIGAFPAAVIAGALDFASALRLVALRGDLMEQAYPHGYGLTAIMGLTDRVEALMQGHEVYLANLNAETQIVIAGRDEAMARWRSWRWQAAPAKPAAGGQRAVALRAAG
jgi:malonate decarboxylase epsilon subunit